MKYKIFSLKITKDTKFWWLRSYLGLTLLTSGLLLSSCSTSKSVKETRRVLKEAYEIQKPVVVQTSKKDNRPKWTKKTSFEDDGRLYFSGGFLNGADYAVTVRCANAEALKVLVQSLGEFIRAEFTEYVKGPNTGADGVDRYVEDGIATFVEILFIQGVRQKEIYYEETFAATAMQSTYNVWVQIEISMVDYLKGKAESLRRLRDRFVKEGQIEAKEKAERLLEELKENIQRDA
jgi:hypothetical protein